MNQTTSKTDLNLEKLLSGLSPEARLRVENALNEALAKEGAGLRAGFDRGPFDRSGFDRSSARELGEAEEKFVQKAGSPPAVDQRKASA